MDIDDYANWARQADGEETPPQSSDTHLAILAFSLIGDAGEVGEMIKRRLRDGTLDRERLAYELGDVIYYWAPLCAALGVAPSAVLAESRRHVEARLAKRAAGSSATALGAGEVKWGERRRRSHAATQHNNAILTPCLTPLSNLSLHLHSACSDKDMRRASWAIVIAISSGKERRIASAVGGVCLCRTEIWYIPKSKP